VTGKPVTRANYRFLTPSSRHQEAPVRLPVSDALKTEDRIPATGFRIGVKSRRQKPVVENGKIGRKSVVF
jgi:hypothetical protein